MDFRLLYKFFEGLTTPEEEIAIRNWVDNSPDNEKRFFEERKMFDAIILNSVQRDAFEEPISNVKPLRKSVFLREFLKIAAVVTLTFLSSWYYFSNVENNQDLVAMQTIEVPAGQRLNIKLPDGTDVWLNAKTTLQYPVSFNKKERLVILDGQAYFDVAKNKEAPFVVKTTCGIIEALGTKFDVMSYSDNQVFETMLVEGSVKVGVINGPVQSLILTPSNKAYIKDGKLETSYVEDFNAYKWKEGLISFKNEAFQEIMKSFEKLYDIQIVMQNSKISNLKYTGKFRIVDGVDYALRVLQKDVEFSYSRDTEHHIIYIK